SRATHPSAARLSSVPPAVGTALSRGVSSGSCPAAKASPSLPCLQRKLRRFVPNLTFAASVPAVPIRFEMVSLRIRGGGRRIADGQAMQVVEQALDRVFRQQGGFALELFANGHGHRIGCRQRLVKSEDGAEFFSGNAALCHLPSASGRANRPR